MLNCKNLIFITLILIFLSDCRLQIGTQAIAIFAIFTIITLLILIWVNSRYVHNILKYSIKLTPIKYLWIFILWLIVDIFISCHSISSIAHSVLRAIIVFGTIIIPVTFFPLAINPRYVSYEKLYKCFKKIYIFIMSYGLFNYIGRIFDIKLIQHIHFVICSKAYFYAQNSENGLLNATTSPRATSVFAEPSLFGLFIFAFLPFVFDLCTSDKYIVKNKMLNKIIKLTILMLTFTNLFLTKSPIYIVFSLIYTLIYFSKKILKTNKKTVCFLLICTIITFCTICFIKNNNIESNSSGVIKRVEYVVKADNLDVLIMTEKSLGTRICTFVNGFWVIMNNPILGTGYANSTELMRKQMNKSPIILTEEVQRLILNKNMDIGIVSIFFGTWLQTGIIGVILLYIFYIKTIYLAWKYRNFYTDTKRLFITGLTLSSINYIINSFYFAIEQDPMMWFIFGILNSYILTYRLEKRTQIKQIKMEKINVKR